MAKINLNNVNLKFRVRRRKRALLKDSVINAFFRRNANPMMDVHALKDITLEINEGERVGLIGHNGAGKSTLLKVLGGIYPPSSGSVCVDGQVSSLFDITVGFEPDASGWENICFRGYLQGETPRTLRDKLQPTAEFCELKEFLDMPVRYYSAGMAFRLAFSIATAVDPEILLVDEVLSAGDKAFREKTRLRIKEMMDRARLIVVVSHDLNTLEQLCDRVIWLDHGEIRGSGNPREMIRAYSDHVDGGQVQAG